MATDLNPILVSAPSDDEHQHLIVLLEAYNLFRSKSGIRGDLWRHFPITDKIRELNERMSRIAMIVNGKVRPDVARQALREEAIDIVNFAAFIIKQLDEGADLS